MQWHRFAFFTWKVTLHDLDPHLNPQTYQDISFLITDLPVQLNTILITAQNQPGNNGLRLDGFTPMSFTIFCFPCTCKYDESNRFHQKVFSSPYRQKWKFLPSQLVHNIYRQVRNSSSHQVLHNVVYTRQHLELWCFIAHTVFVCIVCY